MEDEPPTPPSARAPAAGADAKAQMFATLYADLRRLADRQLRRSDGVTISPTTLLHETYLDLSQRSAVFPDQARFLGYAAKVMRGLIIDLIRERGAQKRGAGFHITRLDTQIEDPAPDAGELSRLSDVLDGLAAHDPRLAEVVDLRYFCGYSIAEIAAQRGSCERTVQRDWEKARLYLYAQLQDELRR